MKKIAVLHRYPISEALGTNASFLEFLKVLSEKEVSVSYITYRELKPTKRFSFINYLELPFTFDRSNNKDKVLKTFLWILAVPVFVKIKNISNKFDLIYCDDSVPYYGFFTKLLNPKTKIIIRLGDLQSGYAWADKNPKLFRFVLNVEKFMWSRLDGIVAISEPFRLFIENLVPKLKDKVLVVEESVNLDQISEPISHKSTDVTFLFHGSLVPCKGLDLLIQAFSELNQRYSNTKLIIAGGGPEEERLRQLATNLCPKSITFTGWYDHKKLNALMNKTDVSIVMRSPNMANNFVVTTCLLENWSFKKPIIAPNLAAFCGVIQHEKNGLLFEAGNKSDLVSQMSTLYQNKKEWERLGQEGYLTAQRVFSHKLIAHKMANILIQYAEN